jgi:hypothetical protein
MKKEVWDLFVSTGNVGYYRLFKKLENDGTKDQSVDAKGNGLQGK